MYNCENGPNETAYSEGDDAAICFLPFVFAHQHFQLIFDGSSFVCLFTAENLHRECPDPCPPPSLLSEILTRGCRTIV